MSTTQHNPDRLLPDRHPQYDLFICDVADAVLKDVIAQMEHPLYALSKKPDTAVRHYEHNGNWIEITPSVKGLATIYDKDILIYCISQIIDKQKRGEPISPRVRINSHELLIFTNRNTGGRDYKALVDTLDRLEGTRIRTNVRTGDTEQIDGFGLIDTSSVRRKHGLDGRLLWCEITLSNWLFEAIRARDVLTLHRDYFRLRKPVERRIYELARKHCGQQESWTVSLPTLQKKTGAKSTERRFRQMVGDMVKNNHLPDYTVSFGDEPDQLVFWNRGTMPIDRPGSWDGYLDPDTHHSARRAAPSWDIYYLEREWRRWLGENEIEPKYPSKHFIKFCRTWYEKRGPTR